MYKWYCGSMYSKHTATFPILYSKGSLKHTKPYIFLPKRYQNFDVLSDDFWCGVTKTRSLEYLIANHPNVM